MDADFSIGESNAWSCLWLKRQCAQSIVGSSMGADDHSPTVRSTDFGHCYLHHLRFIQLEDLRSKLQFW
ncbi:MAG: hypothetical protein AAF433_21225, partial [Bacteroidota bacterium]